MKLPEEITRDIHCLKCDQILTRVGEHLVCQNPNCKYEYPIVDGIPILINDEFCVFNRSDFVEHRVTTFDHKKAKIYSTIKKLVPSISNNVLAAKNYKKFSSLLLEFESDPKVLVIGGSILGKGMEAILAKSKITLIESDISFGPRTQIIFDAHNIPFPNEFFDGVIIQAVLEHVVDPYRCVDEIHRVLKKNGIVYAETPFMQQVHMGRFDFHRFTYLGHRRLFRNFNEIESGAVCGPGMALAWAYSYFIFSFTRSKKLRKYLIPLTNFSSFFWKYFDYLLIARPGTLDAASGYYFMGNKSENTLSDRDLILYKGLL